MKNTRRSLFAIIALILVSVLAACGSSANNEAPATAATDAPSPAAEEATVRTLTDAAGHEVEVPVHPKRIIAAFMEDPLAALDMKPVAQWGVAGVPQQYLQDKLAGIPVLKMDNGLQPEEVFSYNPDLIIFLTADYVKDGYDQFAKIAPTFILSDNANDWRGNLQKLGTLLNEEDAAQKAVATYDEKLKLAKEQLGSLIEGKTAVLLQPVGENFKLFGPGFYGGAMLYDELGFQKPDMLKGDYDAYSIETLAQLDKVDYIFLLSGEGREKPPADNPLWKGLPAVKGGNVFAADSGHWFNNNSIANGLIIDDVLKYVHE
ncbi:ABC transporter substrate-binding protein [Paenibacillus radicis (ex Gao et al. 2016)]|uniref:Ferrichrome ABC transporter substrate-binding protein n=1 Tax=Paenibacillus radicis (ex Gao et al. 2016) TaxID=1737354 RepID=A0A917HAB8_9BACL|nr:ABC transporter substrate-binding protein [Paenibacillus radicis (ex Gao et al. 2016)]GGG72729.1 ferrichrome ABC transporter substrate-binding protein [Paenibacillus radicis (ex Gao et al. 2016)]